MANLRTNNLYGVSGFTDTNGSALFNGTDYLTAANAMQSRVYEDFTIEAWIYEQQHLMEQMEELLPYIIHREIKRYVLCAHR